MNVPASLLVDENATAPSLAACRNQVHFHAKSLDLHRNCPRLHRHIVVREKLEQAQENIRYLLARYGLERDQHIHVGTERERGILRLGPGKRNALQILLAPLLDQRDKFVGRPMRGRLGIGGDMALLNDRGGVLVNVGQGGEFSFKSIGSSLKRLRCSATILPLVARMPRQRPL